MIIHMTITVVLVDACRIKVILLNLPFQLSSFGKIVILEMKRQIFGSLELRILYNHPVVVYLFNFSQLREICHTEEI